MVKNLPTVERSTKIRFGKNVPDSTDQEENTIVFNASNVSFDVSNPGAVYLSPVRERIDYSDPNVVLLMYDRITKEITESGESATDIIEPSLASATQFGNVTSNTIVFTGSALDAQSISIITSNSVGVVNTSPQNHTLSVGSNLYVHDTGSNVLVVSGNVAILRDLVIDGNLTVNGGTTVIITENLSVGDAIIEIGRNNTSEDTTLDLGLLMHRPGALSNVVIGYREGTDEFALAYTDAKPTDKTFTPKLDEDINVHVYGLTHVDANIYAHEDVLVTGNVYVSTNVSITEELTVSNNVYADKDLEVVGNVYVDGNVVAYKDFTLTGNAYVSGNVSITEELTISNNVYADKDLEVVGNVYVDGNVVAYKDFTLTGNAYVSGNVSITEELTISNNVYADKDLEVMGNVYVDGNVVAYKDFTLTGNAYVNGNVSITEELTISNNVYADKDLEVMGNVYIDGNVIAYKDLSVTGNIYVSGNVSITEELTISNNVYADKDLEVVGNVYVDGNVVAYKDLLVTGNIYVTGNVSITEELTISNNVYADKDLEVMGNVIAHNDLTVTGNVTVDSTTLHVDAESSRVGILTTTPGQPLDVRGAANVGVLTVTSGSVTDVTHSTSKDTGVLVITRGGLGVESNIHSTNVFATSHIGIGTSATSNTFDVRGTANVGALVATSTHISDSTGATSKSSGALRVTGGVGIQGDLYATHANLEDVEADSITVTDATPSISKDTGALIITHGGLGVEANIHATNVFVTSHIGVGTSATSNTFDVRGTANVGALVSTSTHISDSTAASSKSSGALRVKGGTGIQGALHAADTTLDSVKPLNMSTGTIPFTDAAKKLINSIVTQDTEGNISISGNVEITGNISVLGNSFSIKSSDLIINDRIIDIANNNVSTTLDVGILMEHPNKNIFIGHHTSPHDHFSIGYTDAGYSADQVEWTGTDHITANVWGHLITQNTVTVQYGNVYIVDGGLGIGIGDGENDDVPDSKLYVTGNAHFTSNISTASNVLITGIAAATSKTTGALQVTGGVGVGGDIYATNVNFEDVEADSVTVTDTTHSTSKDTGAIIVTTGGVGVESNIHTTNLFATSHIGVGTTATSNVLDIRGTANVGALVTTSTHISDTTTSTTTTSGALKVAGGVGIVENLNVGGVTKVWDNTNAASKTVAALIVVGGIGVTGDIHATDANLEDVEADSVTVTDTTHSTSKDTGAIIVTTGGLGVEANIHSTNVFVTSHIGVGTTATSNTFDVRGTANVGALVTTSTHISDATTSTTKDTGALIITEGGVGIEENLNVGGVIKVWDNTNAGATNEGALQVVGGLGVGQTIFAADMSSGSVNVTDTTHSTTKDTGALIVTTGGLGVESNIHTTNLFATSHIAVGTTATSNTFDVRGTANVGALVTTSTHISDTTISASTTTGALQVKGGIGVANNVHVGNDVYIGSNLNVDTNSLHVDSVSNRVGIGKTNPAFTLDVDGDIRFTGDFYEGDSLFISSPWTIETSPAALNYTAGNVGIGAADPDEKLHVTGNATITGGLMTNTGGFGRKTYSFSTNLASAASVVNATYVLDFTNHPFHAKVTAMLIESDDEISTLSFDVIGGKLGGGSNSAYVPALGQVGVVSTSTMNTPWDPAVATALAGTTVTIKPANPCAGVVRFNIFVDYLSHETAGRLTSINTGGTSPDSGDFGY